MIRLTTLLLFSALFNIQANAQNFVKSSEPFKAKNGQLFKVGDTILIGTPADFSNVYSYYVQGKDLSLKKEAKGEIKIAGEYKKYDNRFQRSIIKGFFIYEKEGTFAVLDKVFNVMIHIDKGIESGELVSNELEKVIRDRTTLFSDSMAYIEHIKFTKDYTIETVKEFLYLFDNTTFNRVREDEFEFNKNINSTKSKLKDGTKNLDSSKVFKIIFEDELGNYDFEKQSFPILWKNNGLHLLSDTWEHRTPIDINKNKVQLTDLKIKFSNTKDFNLMPLIEERANSLVKYRKGPDGTVDRRIRMAIYFTISDMKIGKAIPWEDFSLKSEGVFICRITRIDFFEDAIPAWNYLGSIDK